MTGPMTDRLADVYDATTRYLRTLDGLTPETLAEPSPLPGWTRAHVAAHLALHALGTTRALTGLVHGERLPVYDSPEKRASDIDSTAELPADELRELSFDACDRWKAAIEAVADWDGVMERTPGTGPFTASECVDMRWREVEIHHADLDAGYSHADWSPRFCEILLVAMTKREWNEPFRVAPTDLDGTWSYGDGDGPTVSGTASDLGWWLTGRGSGEGLTSDRGELPKVGAW